MSRALKGKYVQGDLFDLSLDKGGKTPDAEEGQGRAKTSPCAILSHAVGLNISNFMM